MENQTVRLLRAEEIECRAAMVNEKGVSLLLYKDARVDQRILDETFGPFGWKRSHQCIDGSLYCTVEIYDSEKKEWIAKQDVGNMGAREKEKSQASDSFKRACFNWGIGRELYSAPFIWVPACNADIRKKDGKYCCCSRFRVHSIAYGSSREITSLAIADGDGRIVYEWKPAADSVNHAAAAAKQARNTKSAGSAVKSSGNTAPAGHTAKPARNTAGPARYDPPAEHTINSAKDTRNPAGYINSAGNATGHTEMAISGEQMDSLEAELQRTGVGMDAVQKRYGISNPGQMPQETYDRVMRALKKTNSKNAA